VLPPFDSIEAPSPFYLPLACAVDSALSLLCLPPRH